MKEGLWEDHEGSNEPTKVVETEPAPRIWSDTEGQAALETTRRKQGTRRAQRPIHRVRGYVRPTAILFIALFVADAIYVGVRLPAPLLATNRELTSGAGALSEGRLSEAGRSFEDAFDAANLAQRLTDRPSVAFSSLVPRIGPDARALRGLADSGKLAAQAGVEATELGRLLGVTPDELSTSIYEAGQVKFESLESAVPLIAKIDAFLNEAATILGNLRPPNLSPLRAAFEIADAQIGAASSTATKFHALFTALPQIFARDTQKRYLLLFQALGEARATGGVVGTYGILEASDGEIRLGKIGPAKAFSSTPIDPVEPPPGFTIAYGEFALSQWPQANTSPNFPVVAEVFLRMYEELRGESLDGVISMDPIALEHLLRGAQPLRGRGLDVEIRSDNVARVIMVDSYTELTNKEQDVFLGDVVGSYWRQVQSGDVETTATARGLVDAVAEQHLRIYLRDPAATDAINELGADGGLIDEPSGSQLIFHNNYAPNKVDYFLDRSVDTEIEVTPDGDALVETTFYMDNKAPKGPPSALLGDSDIRPGTNRMALHFLLPMGAEASSLMINGTPRSLFLFEDAGHPVVWDVLEIPPGGQAQATLLYTVRDFATLAGPGNGLSFKLLSQPGARPESYSLTVTAPGGFVIESASGSGEASSTFHEDGLLRGHATFDLNFVEE